MANESYIINGFEFLKRIEKLWQEKENEKPIEERRKLKQTLLANDIGLNDKQVSKWNTDELGCPSMKTLMKIKETYNCSLDYLLGLDDNKPNKEKDLFDILEELLFYDIKHPNANIIFKTDTDHLVESLYRDYGIISFYTDSEDIPDIFHYCVSIIADYYEVRPALVRLKERQREMIIEDIIDESRNKYYYPFR